MGAVDYRALVPRTPPEGLAEWVLENCRSELDRYGLVYEVDYDDLFCDWPLALPEGYKRTKMVRVTCSCCGDMRGWNNFLVLTEKYITPEKKPRRRWKRWRQKMRPIDADKISVDFAEILERDYEDDYARGFQAALVAVLRYETISPPPNAPLTLEELREMDGEEEYGKSWLAYRRKSEEATL